MALRKPLVRIGGKVRQLPAGDELAGTGVDFTIIYPNGGSADSPANVTISTRYIENNPFAGNHVVVVAEVFFSGRWVITGWFNSAVANAGVLAGHDTLVDKIIISCAGNSLLYGWQVSGSSSPVSNTGGSLASTLPCRVKVWKVKGALV